MADFIMPPDEGTDQRKAAAPLSGTNFVMPQDPNPVALVNARDAASGNPEEYARAKKIAERLSLPVPVVQSDLPSFDTEQKVTEMQARMARDPFYAQQMRDPNFAKLSSGDEGVLGAVKDVVTFPWKATQAVAGGAYQLASGVYGATAAPFELASQITKPLVGTVLPEDIFGKVGAGLRGLSTSAREYGKRVSDVPADAGIVRASIASGFESLGQNLLPMVAALYTGNAPAALAIMSTATGGQSYAKAREAGLTPLQATKYGLTDAGFEYLTEIMPLTKLLGEMKAGTPFVKAFMHNQVSEQLGEQAATVLQDFNEWATLNADKPFSDYLAQRPVAALQTAIATAIGSGGQVALLHVAQKAAGMKVEAAQKDAAALQALLDYADKSALAKRDIPTFTQFVNDAAAQGPVDSVYVDAALFQQAAQQAGVNLQETMPETAAAIEEAVATHSDVRIPLGEFAANSTLFQPEIVQHLKTDPNGSTLLETQDAAWVKETQDATEKALAQQEFTDAIKQSAESVKKELKTQLDAANRFTPEVNDAYAGFMSAFYATQAARLGITPEEMYVRYPLRIQSQNFEGANVLTQQKGSMLNVGHNIGDAVNAVKPEELQAAVEALGVNVLAHEQIQSDTSSQEKTSVITTDRVLTPAEVHALSMQFGQKAIAHLNLATREGELYGPERDWWVENYGPFNPDYFYGSDGRTLAVAGDTLFQSVPLRRGTATLAKYGLPKRDKPYTTREVAQALERRQRDKYGTIDLKDRSDESARKIAKWMVEEIEFELEDANNSGMGWYTTRFQEALDDFAQAYPELKTDQNARDIFTLIVAVASNGQDVVDNFRIAASTYEHYRATGSIAMQGNALRATEMQGHLNKMQALLEQHGSPEALKAYLLQTKTVSELKRMAKEQGEVLNTEYPANMRLPMSALVISPKLGAFYANLMGQAEYLTMDRWWSRLFNRYRGHLLETPTEQGVKRVRTLLDNEDLTDDEVLQSLKPYVDAYEAKGFKNGTELEVAANTLYKAAFVNLRDTPDNASDRDFMVRSVLFAASNLKRRGKVIAPADIQAILWYYEKRLYNELGTRDSGSYSYADAARIVTGELAGGNDRPAGRTVPVGGTTLQQSPLAPAGIPEYGQHVPGSVSVVGVHYSPSERGYLSSAAYGRGMKGAEYERVMSSSDPRIKQRVHFYVNQGEGVQPESGVGSVAHAVRLDGLYDATADRLGLFRSGDMNAAESAVLDNGFEGYYSRNFNKQGAVVLLGQHNVPVQKVDPSTIRELPPPVDYTPERELAEALVAVKGLPSGQMSGPEWLNMLQAVAPQIAERIPAEARAKVAASGLMYRDQVAKTFYQSTTKDQTETPAFKAWFGDSKVVDANGAPLVVYHSTVADFDAFKTRPGDVGMHFGTAGQAEDRYNLKIENDPYGPGLRGVQHSTMPVYLSIKNPLRLPDLGAWDADNMRSGLWEALPHDRKAIRGLRTVAQVRSFLHALGYDGIVYANTGETQGGAEMRDALNKTRAERQAAWYEKRGKAEGTPEYEAFLEAERAHTLSSQKYEDFRNANAEDSYIVFRPEQVKSAIGNTGEFNPKNKSIVNQGETAPRGQISFGSDVQKTPSVLTLLANADLSTFLHESGHFYLEVLRDMAAQPDAPAEIVADFAKTLQWFGIKDTAQWDSMSLEARRPFHEQFARGFEAYLFEGKAPSETLQSTYQRFRAWLVNVYQQVKALNVTLTDEVRGVFDRLVASTDEILQAETARTFQPLYETKPEGMTDAEWGDYHVLGGEATQEAVDLLQTRSLRDMQYASRAKSAALKRLQQHAAALRKGMRAEVSAEVNAEPIYQVMRFLKTGVYEGESAGTYTIHKLDSATLNEMYPADMPDRPPILNLAGMRGPDGIAPDVVARMFGYGSGDVLVRELLNTEPINSKIDGLTDQRMLERYGDLADPVALEKAANAAVHNEVRAKFIATELRALDKAAGNKPTLMAMAREFASTLISRKVIRQIRPPVYAAAAAKAAKNASTAFRKDDVANAAGEKRNQLVNVYAAKYANEALDEVEKSVAYLKRVGESKSIDPEYRAQINSLLERFDLRKVSGAEVARRQSLLQWMDSQREKGFEPAIDPALENEALRKPYQDMTLEEFRGLVDSIKNIEHLGRLKAKLLKMADQREFAAVVADAEASIRANAKKTIPHETEATMSARKQILAFHTKLSSFMRQLDGWSDNGIMQRLFTHSSNAAGATEAKMHEQATMKLIALFEPMMANESKRQRIGRAVTPFGLNHGYMGEKLFIPEINESLSREARIMIAMNTGTEGNLQRLMDGDHWTDKQVQAVVDTLTKQEMDFVQSVWDFIGSYRDPVGAQQKRLTGVEPTWIPARQVITKHGTYAGGYLPAKYNGAMSTRSLSDEAAANLTDALRATRGSAAARASFTKERAAKVINRPLRKDFGVITQHLTEVTHRLAWQEWLVDANRLLRANAIDSAIREHYGPEMLESLRENIEAIAAGNVGAQNAMERGVNYLRTGATVAGLGWRLTTSLLQPIGLTQSMVRVGPKWIGKGLVEFLGDAAHMENSMSKIAEKSDMMRLRAKTMQREISEIQDSVKGEGGAIKGSFFYLIQKMQMVADIPTWLGAYHKALETSGILDPAKLEANAIAQADQAVLDAQGGGQVKDLPAALRGSPYLKLWTNFASFFIGTTFQLTRESVGRTKFNSPASVLMLAVDFVLLYSLPAALGTLMKYALSDDDDEKKLVRNMISDQLSYMLGTMIGLRELGSVARAAVGLPGDYGGPAGARILGEITKLGKQVQQGEADAAFWKALNSAAGVLFHYPAGQINTTADGIAALAEGKTVNPGVLAVGSSKN